MMKKYWYSAVLLSLLMSGCSDDNNNDFDFMIFADPARTHAPGTVHFELNRDDGQPSVICTGSWDFGDGITLSGDYEADHRYREAGTYTVDVDLECSGKKSHASTKIEVYKTVDLSVSALEARPLDVSTNGSITVSFQVSNGADGPLRVPTYIDIYLSPTASETAYLEAGSTRVYRHTLQELPAAGSDDSIQKLEFEVPMDATIRTGAYYVSAVINPDKTIGESSYDNNVTFSTQSLTVRNQSTDGADFVPTRLQISPTSTSILTAATAQFEVLNQGSTTSETFGYEIWLGAKDNATDMEGAVKIHESTIDGGISGIEQSFKNILISIAPAISDPGLYYFWLVLDPSNTIVERDENNNTVRSVSPIQVTNEAVLDADITVQKVEFFPSSTTPGGTFSVDIDLYNQGSQPTGSFVCTVLLSQDMSLDLDKDHIVGSINIDDLPALASRSMTGIMETDTGIKPGKYWVYTFCDSSGIIGEANEDNNIQRGAEQLVVSSAANVELVLGQPQLESSSTIKNGDPLAVSVPLCNKGTTSAGPSYISVTRINQCDNTESEFKRIYIEGLEPGKCMTVQVNEPLKCDFWCPNYKFRFTADATMIVSEINETNNTIDLAQTIAMTGSQCVCAGDKYEPNNQTSSAKTVKTVKEDLTLCPNDDDFYRIDIKENENFEVHVSHDHKLSPLKMELYRGSNLAQTFEGADDLYFSGIHYKNVSAQPVYLRVTGQTPSDANRYHMDLSVYDKTEGIDLALAGLEIDGGALNASEFKDVTVTTANLGTKASPKFTISYYLSQTPKIDKTAWKITQQSVAALAPNTTNQQSVSLKLPIDTAGGIYYLIAKIDDQKDLKDARTSNNTARTSAWNFERNCWDVLDPNETQETARKIDLSDGHFHQDALAVCQSNRDFYAFDMLHGSTLDITATATKSGDFDIVLYDPNMNEIASSRTGSPTETIHRDLIVGDQTMYLEVFLLENEYNASETAYSLDIKTGKAQSWNNCSPVFEPNNFLTSAYDLREAAQSGEEAAICPSDDEDYYRIDMVSGDRIQIGFKTQSSGLRVGLYGGEDVHFIQLLTNPQKQTLDYTATEDGTYYVRVYTNVSAAPVMPYTMQWLGEDGVDLAISSLSAVPMSPSSNAPFLVDFDLKNQGTLDSEYQTLITLTGSQQYVLAKETGSLAAGKSAHFSKKLTVPAQLQGQATLSVAVKADNDVAQNNNSASLIVDVQPACQNDASEPNDNILKATPISSTYSGTICPGDEDWFKVTLTAPATIQLKLEHANGDLDLFVYDEKGDLKSSSATAQDTESVDISEAGTYYLLVRGADSTISNTYTLSSGASSDN
ncbi:MAG: pre-peptidase C-terminal domain-containing protein [Proteobacteria bacterium]|nr:pre-peptidase C-terminal domain-containing protein [Pseudomonadota bacterium]